MLTFNYRFIIQPSYRRHPWRQTWEQVIEALEESGAGQRANMYSNIAYLRKGCHFIFETHGGKLCEVIAFRDQRRQASSHGALSDKEDAVDLTACK